MKTERRWMKSVLAESAKPTPAMPWQRGSRRMPASLRPDAAPAKASAAIAAR